jgi:hypothetical protein
MMAKSLSLIKSRPRTNSSVAPSLETGEDLSDIEEVD